MVTFRLARVAHTTRLHHGDGRVIRGNGAKTSVVYPHRLGGRVRLGAMSGFRVVICGGGIAAVEGLLRLRRLVGDDVDGHRISRRTRSFATGRSRSRSRSPARGRRYPLAADRQRAPHASSCEDALEWVDARRPGRSHGRREASSSYDALLLALGARSVAPFEHATTFDDAHADETYLGIVQDIEEGYTKTRRADRARGAGVGAAGLRAGAPDRRPRLRAPASTT